MRHSFSVAVAEIVGVNAAVIFENMAFWVSLNESQGRNFNDGKTWTFSSVRAYKELFPYLTEKQIRNSIDKLISSGLIEVGNYNKSSYDRTRWFAISDKGKSFCRRGHNDFSKRANGTAQSGEPIPDRKTDKKQNSKTRYVNEREQDFSLDPFSM